MDDRAFLLYGLASGFVIKAASLAWLGSKSRREYVGTVSRICIHPLKSGRALPDVQSAALTRHGLKIGDIADRHLVVIKQNGTFSSRMSNGRFTRIEPNLKEGRLFLTSPDRDMIEINLNDVIKENKLINLNIRLVPTVALDCGDKAAAWISHVLQEDGVRLGFSAPSLAKRQGTTVKKDWPTLIKEGDEVAFQDFVQCNILGNSSLEALNARLQKPVSVHNFRPNIMIQGSRPFDEDNWQAVFIGDKAHIRYVDLCPRCLITTVDPETGVKDKDQQPLSELKKFRLMEPYGKKPLLGVHCSVVTEGRVNIGDPVYVVRKR